MKKKKRRGDNDEVIHDMQLILHLMVGVNFPRDIKVPNNFNSPCAGILNVRLSIIVFATALNLDYWRRIVAKIVAAVALSMRYKAFQALLRGIVFGRCLPPGGGSIKAKDLGNASTAAVAAAITSYLGSKRLVNFRFGNMLLPDALPGGDGADNQGDIVFNDAVETYLLEK
jgi:hypothetical protein